MFNAICGVNLRILKRRQWLLYSRRSFDDSQVDLALSKAEEFCEKLSSGNSHWEAQMQNKTGKRRMGKMMLLVADTFLTLGMLYKSFDRITPGNG